jgi:hypothetical protein
MEIFEGSPKVVFGEYEPDTREFDHPGIPTPMLKRKPIPLLARYIWLPR